MVYMKINPLRHEAATCEVLAAIDAIMAYNPTLQAVIYTEHGNNLVIHTYTDDIRHTSECLVTNYPPIEDGLDEGDTFPWCTCHYHRYPTAIINGNRTKK